MVLARNFIKKKNFWAFLKPHEIWKIRQFFFFFFFLYIYGFWASYGTQLYAISSIIPPKNSSGYYSTLSIPPQLGPDVEKSPNYGCRFDDGILFFFFLWIFGILCASTISHYLEIYKKNQSSGYYWHFSVPPHQPDTPTPSNFSAKQ